MHWWSNHLRLCKKPCIFSFWRYRVFLPYRFTALWLTAKLEYSVVYMCVHCMHVWNLANMKTLGTVHSNYILVVACLRKLSLLLSFCYRFHAWCKSEHHVTWQCCSKGLKLKRSKPSHLCPSIYPPRAVMHWPWQFGTVVGFLCVCLLHTTSRMSRVFNKSHRGLACVFSSLSFYRGLSMLPEKRTCKY